MDENDKARTLEERHARSGNVRELSFGRGQGVWPEPLAESAELTQGELGLLHSQVPGHHWNGWCRLTGDEDYYAACSCGWRSTDAGDVSTMLCQVKDHLDAVWQSRGSPRPAWARDESGSDVRPGDIVHVYERARELRATAIGERMRLSGSASHSVDLLSASAEQADRLVAELERTQSARTGASAPNAVQHKVERARQLRRAIVAAAAALAVITEEIAAIPLEISHEKAIDWIYGEQLIEPAEAKPASRKAQDK